MPVMAFHPEILIALDDEWRTAREIHARLGMWAPRSVRHMLMEMAQSGMIDAEMRARPRDVSVWHFRTRRGPWCHLANTMQARNDSKQL